MIHQKICCVLTFYFPHHGISFKITIYAWLYHKSFIGSVRFPLCFLSAKFSRNANCRIIMVLWKSWKLLEIHSKYSYLKLVRSCKHYQTTHSLATMKSLAIHSRMRWGQIIHLQARTLCRNNGRFIPILHLDNARHAIVWFTCNPLWCPTRSPTTRSL